MTFACVNGVLRSYEDQLVEVRAAVGTEAMGSSAIALQQFFNQHLWSVVTQMELPMGPQRSQWRGVITEIHRHMRLLAVDVSFVQAARLGPTRQRRLEQFEQRLDQLQGFTQVLIKLMSELMSEDVMPVPMPVPMPEDLVQ